MTDLITLTDTQAPERGTVAYGALYEALLDAHVFGHAAQIPSSEIEHLQAWLTETMRTAQGSLRGLAIGGIPEEWLPVLRWAGVPLSLDGPLHWGVDIVCGQVSSPEVVAGVLKLPDIEATGFLTSLGMRPVRHFVADRFGIRLQAANAISCYLWDNQMLLISNAMVLAGGFVHGPSKGKRVSLAIQSGSTQLVSWTND